MLTAPCEINAVTGALIDAQFVNAAADRLRIAKQADLNSRKPPLDRFNRAPISQRF
jgi:hypothetical protein